MQFSTITILGTHVHLLARDHIHAQLATFLETPGTKHIATVNPEFLLEAQKNPPFRSILNNCTLAIPDGGGIRFAVWITKLKAFIRHTKPFSVSTFAVYPGADLVMHVLALAEKKHCSVFLVAHANGLSTWQQTAVAIKKKHPRLKVDGINFDPQKNTDFPRNLLAKADVVLCNFGAPEQEIFLSEAKNDTIRLAMGVGGSFDYLTAKVPRAPLFLRQIGLEWLFRLLVQPWRLGRIFRAVIVFPLKTLFSKNTNF